MSSGDLEDNKDLSFNKFDDISARIDSLGGGRGERRSRGKSRLEGFESPDFTVDLDSGDIDDLESVSRSTFKMKTATSTPSTSYEMDKKDSGADKKAKKKKSKKDKKGFFGRVKNVFSKKQEGKPEPTDKAPEKKEIPVEPISRPKKEELVPVKVKKAPVLEPEPIEEIKTKSEKKPLLVKKEKPPKGKKKIGLRLGRKKKEKEKKKKPPKKAEKKKSPESGGRGLNHFVVSRREKKLDKYRVRAQKRSDRRVDLSRVKRRLEKRRGMATKNEKHIIENVVDTGTPLSPLYRRFLAYILDLVMIVGLSIMLIVVTGWIQWWIGIYFLVGMLYFIITETIFGRGFGKRICNIYVTDMDFEYIDLGRGIIQSFFKIFPILNLIDAIYAVFHPLTKQRLANKLTGTIVIIGD